MAGGYDSWADESFERGDGYAIGGTVRRHGVRPKGKWRAYVAHHARLAARTVREFVDTPELQDQMRRAYILTLHMKGF